MLSMTCTSVSHFKLPDNTPDNNVYDKGHRSYYYTLESCIINMVIIVRLNKVKSFSNRTYSVTVCEDVHSSQNC